MIKLHQVKGLVLNRAPYFTFFSFVRDPGKRLQTYKKQPNIKPDVGAQI